MHATWPARNSRPARSRTPTANPGIRWACVQGLFVDNALGGRLCKHCLLAWPWLWHGLLRASGAPKQQEVQRVYQAGCAQQLPHPSPFVQHRVHEELAATVASKVPMASVPAAAATPVTAAPAAAAWPITAVKPVILVIAASPPPALTPGLDPDNLQVAHCLSANALAMAPAMVLRSPA